MMKRIEEIQVRIDKLKTELVMGNYNNGWLNEEYRKEIKELENQLLTLINKSNDNSSILDS